LAGSDIDGEAVAAVRKARKVLADAGMSFTDLTQMIAKNGQGAFAERGGKTHQRISEAMRAYLQDSNLQFLTDREIARRTGVSPQTVGNWRRRLSRTS
jgi:transcriptional regulator with XRE-family HTH domain